MKKEQEFWTNEVEEAVSKYATCTDSNEKNKIFNKYLYSAFKKLIDNVIERYSPHDESLSNEEIKNDLLSTLAIQVQRFDSNRILSNGKKPNARIYCEVIIRCSIADYRVKLFHEKQNVCFNESHEKFLNNIN